MAKRDKNKFEVKNVEQVETAQEEVKNEDAVQTENTEAVETPADIENQEDTNTGIDTDTSILEAPVITFDGNVKVNTPFSITMEIEDKEQLKEEIAEYKNLADNGQIININTVAEEKQTIVKELEIAINEARVLDDHTIAHELNGIMECLQYLRNRISHLHTNYAQNEPVVMRIKKEVLGIET